MPNLRLMSHNQWNRDDNRPEWAARGLDCSAAHRMRGIARVFDELQPDVVGCQEISIKMADLLIRYTAEAGVRYALLWGRYTPIVYRSDKLELVDSAFLTYPDACPGFAGPFNDVLSKACNVAVFRVKESGRLFVFASTHLWWKSGNPASAHYLAGSDEARAYQMGLAAEAVVAMQEKYACPAVLVGDMNARLDSPALARAFAAGFVHAHDVAVEYADETSGYHICNNAGYGPYRDAPFAAAIDHILVRGAEAGFVRRFDRYQPEYYLPLSDHAPVFADVEI